MTVPVKAGDSRRPGKTSLYLPPDVRDGEGCPLARQLVDPRRDVDFVCLRDVRHHRPLVPLHESVGGVVQVRPDHARQVLLVLRRRLRDGIGVDPHVAGRAAGDEAERDKVPGGDEEAPEELGVDDLRVLVENDFVLRPL